MKIFSTVLLIIFISVALSSCGKKEEKPKSGEIKSEPSVEESGMMYSKKEGDTTTSYYPGGQKETEGTFTNGAMVGKWTSWYKNGQLQREENYVDSLLEGERKVWYENGQMKESASYKKGKLVGVKTTWDDKGILLSEVQYKDGVAVAGDKG